MQGVLKTAKLAALEHVFRKPRTLRLPQAIFSFTFDDVPRSAATEGAKLLEDHGIRGTYYVACGIESPGNSCDPLATPTDLRELCSRGHDIQCHTHRHINLRTTRTKVALQDCATNRAAIQSATGQAQVKHFAYPFGAVGLGAKKALGNVYETMRTVDCGINHGPTDMTHLRAIGIFSATIDMAEIETIIKASIEKRAWTIFFTHDVRSDPTPFGITPGDLGRVVKRIVDHGGQGCTVSQAFERIVASQGR